MAEIVDAKPAMAKGAGALPASGSTLTQYIVVRRDLPFGVMLAMVAHAAGESYQTPRSSGLEHPLSLDAHSQGKGEVGGSLPSGGTIPSGPTVVVLGARNEARLRRLRNELEDDGVTHVAIVEPDAPYYGQLMAIGFPPQPQVRGGWIKDFQMIRLEDCPEIMKDEL